MPWLPVVNNNLCCRVLKKQLFGLNGCKLCHLFIWSYSKLQEQFSAPPLPTFKENTKNLFCLLCICSEIKLNNTCLIKLIMVICAVYFGYIFDTQNNFSHINLEWSLLISSITEVHNINSYNRKKFCWMRLHFFHDLHHYR